MADILVHEAAVDQLPRILKKQIHDIHVAGRPDLFAPLENPEAFVQQAAQQDMRLLIAESAGEAVGYALIRAVNRASNPYMKERRFLQVQ